MNELVNQARRGGRGFSLPLEDLEEPDRVPPGADEAPDLRLDLERALERLPEGARLVFVLHDVEGWSHVEIAEQLGVSVGTTKSQLHRARRLLREGLFSWSSEGASREDR